MRNCAIASFIGAGTPVDNATHCFFDGCYHLLDGGVAVSLRHGLASLFGTAADLTSRSPAQGRRNEHAGWDCRWRSDAAGCMLRAMRSLFDQSDFSVVVKNRAPPPKSWRWEIYRAGRNSPIECSSILYETVAAGSRVGEQAVRVVVSEFPIDE